MGIVQSDVNLQSKILDNNKSSQMQEYTLAQYGGKVLVDRRRGVVVKKFHVPQQQVSQFLKIMNRRKKLRHPNLAEFMTLQQQQVDGSPLCKSSFHTYRLEYELLTYSLFNQIQRHCQLRQPVPQAQVCRIFQAVVDCLDYLKMNNTLHGDVKVGSIFLDKERGVKLVDSFMLKQGKTNYQVVLEDPKSMSLLSPQQLELLRIKLFDTLEGTSRNEIFMVGLSMLEVTTIRQGMNCYNLDNLTINEPFFMTAMQDIQDCGYSGQLSNLIMNCVHKQPSKRPSFQQFLRQIRTIRRKISPNLLKNQNTHNTKAIHVQDTKNNHFQFLHGESSVLNRNTKLSHSRDFQMIKNSSVDVKQKRQSGEFTKTDKSIRSSQEIAKDRGSKKVSLRVN